MTDEEEEDGQPDVMYGAGSKGPDREEMAADYLPDQDDWVAKTILDLNDPARVAMIRNFGEFFPELDHHQDALDEYLDQFLKGRTSIAGKSREEYGRIIESMYGGHPDDQTGNKLIDALGSSLEDDD